MSGVSDFSRGGEGCEDVFFFFSIFFLRQRVGLNSVRGQQRHSWLGLNPGRSVLANQDEANSFLCIVLYPAAIQERSNYALPAEYGVLSLPFILARSLIFPLFFLSVKKSSIVLFGSLVCGGRILGCYGCCIIIFSFYPRFWSGEAQTALGITSILKIISHNDISVIRLKSVNTYMEKNGFNILHAIHLLSSEVLWTLLIKSFPSDSRCLKRK